jgi:hypothetical protein
VLPLTATVMLFTTLNAWFTPLAFVSPTGLSAQAKLQQARQREQRQ